MKIRDIRDPSLFQRLVHRVYIAERGHEFQVVDDSGGDRGNDGYDVGRRLIVAVYCPMKPDTADYRKKALADLEKAALLRRSKGYSVEGWMFVTPSALREPLQAELRAKAQEFELKAVFIADAHLEDLYRRHAHLHDDFPELEYPRVAEKLDAIHADIQGLKGPAGPDQPQPEAKKVNEATSSMSLGLLRGFISPELAHLRDRVMAGDGSAVTALEQFRMKATDIRDSLGALMLELEYELEHYNWTRSEQLAQDGIELATKNGVLAEGAVLRAHLAYILVLPLVKDDMEMVSLVSFSNGVGVPLLSSTELAKAKQDLEHRKTQVDSLLAKAVSEVMSSGDIAAQYTVALRVGACHAQRSLPFRLAEEVGLGDNATTRQWFLSHTEQAYTAAIQRATLLGPGYVAQAFHNFANDLVLFDEYPRAKAHAEHALEQAQLAGEEDQVARSKLLLEKIERDTTT